MIQSKVYFPHFKVNELNDDADTVKGLLLGEGVNVETII